jgi:RsiW-degrading membrane proteinase PrsW (M82 family)
MIRAWLSAPLTWRNLIIMAAVIFGGFALAAFAWSRFAPNPVDAAERAEALYTSSPRKAEAFLSRELQTHPEDHAAWLVLVRYRSLMRALLEEGDGAQASFEAHLSDEEFFALLDRSPDPALYRALYVAGRNPQTAEAQLGRAPDGDFLVEVAQLLRWHDRGRDALAYFRRAEPMLGDVSAGAVRSEILNLLLELEYYAEFNESMERAEYRSAADANARAEYHRNRGEFLTMIAPMVELSFQNYRWQTLSAACLTGLGWIAFCLALGRAGQWPRAHLIAGLLALPLGAASAIATLVAVSITEVYIPFNQLEPTILNNLLYCILGIGLREELLKLIFLLPLLPWLKKMEDLPLLVVCSLAGLGFAIEENTAYYDDYGGGAVLARFLTANFFHITLTGLAGFYLTRAIRGERGGYETFFEQFGLMVLLHGVYDFFYIDQTIGEGWLSLAIYVWLAWQYLRLAMQIGAAGRRQTPLTRIFVGAVSASAGVGYLLLATEMGPGDAFFETLQSLAGVALLTLVFFREFDEPITRA